MADKLIPATQLAEYVYCSQAWYLKLQGAQVSAETRGIQAQANAWHEEQGRSLAKGDGYRWAAYAAALLAAVFFLFCWLGWSQ
jgi:hypothetical protein